MVRTHPTELFRSRAAHALMAFAAALWLHGCGEDAPSPTDDTTPDSEVDGTPDGGVEVPPDAEPEVTPDGTPDPVPDPDTDPDTDSDTDSDTDTDSDSDSDTAPAPCRTRESAPLSPPVSAAGGRARRARRVNTKAHKASGQIGTRGIGAMAFVLVALLLSTYWLANQQQDRALREQAIENAAEYTNVLAQF